MKKIIAREKSSKPKRRVGREPLNLIGERFERGIVLSFVEIRGNGKNRLRYWLLRCNCGNEYEASTGSLRHKHVRSCGCLAREVQTRNARLYGTPASTKPPGVAAFNQLIAVYKKGALEKNLEWGLKNEEFRCFIYGDCHYCGIPPSRTHKSNGKKTSGIVVNGVDRIDSEAGYTMDNCVSCCYHCNISKRSRSKEDFLDWVARVYCHSLAKEIV